MARFPRGTLPAWYVWEDPLRNEACLYVPLANCADTGVSAAVSLIAADAAGSGAWVVNTRGLAHITLHSDITLASTAERLQAQTVERFDRHGTRIHMGRHCFDVNHPRALL